MLIDTLYILLKENNRQIYKIYPFIILYHPKKYFPHDIEIPTKILLYLS